MRRYHPKALLCVVGTFLGLIISGGGCYVADPEAVASNTSSLKSDCPENWVDPNYVQIDCIEGYEIIKKEFHGNECVRCAPEGGGSICDTDWVPSTDELSCHERGELVYNASRTCKQCVDTGRKTSY